MEKAAHWASVEQADVEASGVAKTRRADAATLATDERV
jgi:hypothetical protein